jgi:Uma2 family endonuclease
MSKPSHAHVSEAEFLSWPESTGRIELIDGLVVRRPAASFGHQKVLMRLVRRLEDWADGRPVTVGQSPCDVRFGNNRILQPDAFVIFEPTRLSHRGPITRIPELCIEVLSQDERYDRVTKRRIYAEAGVRELWLVDIAGVVERWTGEGLESMETIATTLRTPLLDGFELDVQALVAEG